MKPTEHCLLYSMHFKPNYNLNFRGERIVKHTGNVLYLTDAQYGGSI